VKIGGEMKKRLLILGAGGHGRVVREAAEAMDCFTEIIFLDDCSDFGKGKLNDFVNYDNSVYSVNVAIGNNKVRGDLVDKVRNCGFDLPVIIHPTAYVSKSSFIDSGTYIGPLSVLNTNSKVGLGCIIGANSVVDHDSTLCNYVQVNSRRVVKAGSEIFDFSKIDS